MLLAVLDDIFMPPSVKFPVMENVKPATSIELPRNQAHVTLSINQNVILALVTNYHASCTISFPSQLLPYEPSRLYYQAICL